MTVTRAWGLLLMLSALSTLVAATGTEGRWLAVPVLALAFLKARLILDRYLGLARAPAIAAAFAFVLGLYVLVLAGLAVLAA